MPAHTMSWFQLSKETNHQIDMISKDFFWKKSNGNTGLSMVSWDKVCRPKKAGRLVLRKIEAVNSAFLSKLTQKLFDGQSLWVEQMQGKYPIDENFFPRN